MFKNVVGLFSAITTISAPENGNNITVVEVDNTSTLSITSGVFFEGGNGTLSSTPDTFVYHNRVRVPSNSAISSNVTAIFHTPGSFANRSDIRVCYRNKVLIARRILATILLTNTETTRTKRFAHETFMGNGVKLDRTRTLNKLLRTGDFSRLDLTHKNVHKGLSEDVETICSDLYSIVAKVCTTVSFPSRSLGRCSHRSVYTLMSDAIQGVSGLSTACHAKHTISRKVPAIVYKHAGTKGDSICGTVINCSTTVIASVRKAAQSILHRSTSLNGAALLLYSATNVQRAPSAIRDVNVRHTLHRVSDTRLILTIFSDSSRLNRSSATLTRHLYTSNGTIVTLLGGSSLATGT